MMVDFLVLLALYLVIGTGIVIVVHRAKQSHEEYFVGGRKISGVVSALTYAATTYSAFMMVGLVGLAYQTGVGALIFELCYLVSTIALLSIYGRKIWERGREQGLVSPMELFMERFGSATRAAGALVAMVALIPYSATQVIALALVFQNYGGFSFAVGAGFAAVIIALWAVLGGLRGVALTDAIQGVFLLAVALIAVVWMGNRFKGFELSTFPSFFWTPTRFISLTLPWIFFALTNPQVVQRLFIPRDRKAFRNMIVYFGIFGLIYTVIVTLIGFSARFGLEQGVFPEVADRDKVILEIFGQMARWLSLPLALSIIFAAVSTANSIVLTLSSMLLRDVIRQKAKVWLGRGIILLLTLLVFLFSLRRPNYIVELSVTSSSILLCFLPLIFGIFHWKHGGRLTGLITVLGGAATAIVLGVLNVPLSPVYTLLVSFALFFLGGLVEKRGSGGDWVRRE
jgi:SSS family solute:Na+ symporter